MLLMMPADDIRPPEVRLGPAPERMEPLWDRVDRNRFKLALTVLLFVGGNVVAVDVLVLVAVLPIMLFTSLYSTASAFAGSLLDLLVWTSLIAVGAAGTWSAVAVSRSERWLVRRLGAVIVPKGEALPTKFALKDMALAAGITPAPALYVLETSNVNAFTFAASKRRPIIGVTRGFIDKLPVDEQRAVFANLVARLRSGDTIYATGITALTRPLWYFRDRQLRDSAEQDSAAMLGGHSARRDSAGEGDGMALGWLFVVAATFVAITEVAAFGSRRSQLRQAEVSDAEGMLLLKEPLAMLRALESCIRRNNFVPAAGPGFAQLFYCWTGDATDDEEDPEWRRVMRLREVLGVEGVEPPVIRANSASMAPPSPPRLEQD
jgi:Zn-dependent protease with chaperone function